MSPPLAVPPTPHRQADSSQTKPVISDRNHAQRLGLSRWLRLCSASCGLACDTTLQELPFQPLPTNPQSSLRCSPAIICQEASWFLPVPIFYTCSTMVSGLAHRFPLPCVHLLGDHPLVSSHSPWLWPSLTVAFRLVSVNRERSRTQELLSKYTVVSILGMVPILMKVKVHQERQISKPKLK